MAENFGLYARHYDLLYQNKDTSAEVAFIRRLIERHAPGARTILDLGCGSGRHDLLLAQAGFKVTGVDRSSEMLERATERAAAVGIDRVEWREGDVASVRIEHRFDIVISLFHVLSYQTADESVEAFFRTAITHLSRGGLLLFDYWFGPAVECEKPEKRVKSVENDDCSIVRHATPVMRPEKNICEVNYRIEVTEKSSGRIETIEEVHPMRYFHPDEIARQVASIGATPIETAEWLTEREPGPDTWSVYTACRL